MRDTIRSLVGNELVSELDRHIKEFELLDLDSDQIYNNIKEYNSLTIMCLYLLSLDSDNREISFRIKRAFEKRNLKQMDDFRRLVSLGEEDKLLSKLDKIDVINLAHRMNLYSIDKSEYNKLSEEDRKCCDILNKYIEEK